MGTTVSNLQILGASLADVRAALPHDLVGQWSERFVTACPGELYFCPLERKAGTLSKKLGCTVLSVSMFDGDTLSLVLFQNGKRLTRHSVDPEAGENIAGNPKLFCAALGLPEELAPKLRRLLASREMQEEKLHILQALLGAPLFIRWDDGDDLLPKEPVKADSAPLEAWIRTHPELPKSPRPPRIKNQCQAELIQEIADLCCDGDFGGKSFFFRHPRSTSEWNMPLDTWLSMIYGCREEYILHVSGCNGRLGRLLPDGSLELTLLKEHLPSDELKTHLFGDREGHWGNSSYAVLGGRLITTDTFFTGTDRQSQPYQTVILWDSAGVLPDGLPLVRDGQPIAAERLFLLPDRGLLSADKCHVLVDKKDKIRPVHLQRFGPDGVFQRAVSGEEDLPAEDAAAIHDILESEEKKGLIPDAVTDGQGHVWQYCDKYCECRSPAGELISRHRLPGDMAALYCNDEGQVCAITTDWEKYVTRIYRFT